MKSKMERIEEFRSFKKLLLFGSNGAGKTSLSRVLEKDVSKDDSQSQNSKTYQKFY